MTVKTDIAHMTITRKGDLKHKFYNMKSKNCKSKKT